MQDKKNKIRMVFIPTPRDEPVTGGEIYNKMLFDFLEKRFYDADSIDINIFRGAAKKWNELFFFTIGSLFRNFIYVIRLLKKTDKKIIIMEDIYYSTDLFLFNFFIRRIQKNIR
jgi:hypothetical protein